MGQLLNKLKPASFIEPIEDQQVIDRDYQYWRIRIFYSMFVGYAFFYFTRYSFTFAIPSMMSDLGLNKAQLGILGSVLSLSYGMSKFFSGIVADQSNPKYFMAIGLMITGFLNILFGLSSTLWLFILFWGLNGLFQGTGWPPCARYLTHWYSKNERGRWWSGWNTSHNIGGFTITLFASWCAQYLGWRYAMFLPGTLAICVGFFLLNRLRDTPQSLGLPSIEKYRNDYSGTTRDDSERERELSTKEILFKHVLNNPFIWVLALSNFFIYAIRMAVNDWSLVFLVETKGYSQVGAGGCVGLFQIGGFFGSLLAGWGSDFLFKGRRGPVSVIFTIGIILSAFFFWSIPPGYTLLDSFSMFMMGMWIFGPQMLIGMAAAELAYKKAAATGSGFTGWFGYFGAAAAGYPIGSVIESTGWNGYFMALVGCGVIALVLQLPLLSKRATADYVASSEKKRKGALASSQA